MGGILTQRWSARKDCDIGGGAGTIDVDVDVDVAYRRALYDQYSM